MEDILILALAAISRVEAPKNPFLANSSKALKSNLALESLGILFYPFLYEKKLGARARALLCIICLKIQSKFYPLI